MSQTLPEKLHQGNFLGGIFYRIKKSLAEQNKLKLLALTYKNSLELHFMNICLFNSRLFAIDRHSTRTHGIGIRFKKATFSSTKATSAKIKSRLCLTGINCQSNRGLVVSVVAFGAEGFGPELFSNLSFSSCVKGDMEETKNMTI